jgi:regulatory protein
MLAARPRSERDLRGRLARAGFSHDEVDAAVARLKAAGFLDDATFARQVARHRLVDGRQSARRVRQELARRGVARDVADDALTEVVEDEAVDESESARQLAVRRARHLAGLDPVVATRRLGAFLARRGFSPDVVRDATRWALREAGGATTDDRPGDDP